MGQVLVLVYCNKLVVNLEVHAEALLLPSVFQSHPVQVVEHGCDMGGVIAAVECVPCNWPLDHFQLFYVCLGMQIAHHGGIFKQGSNKHPEGCCFDAWAVYLHIPL